MARTRRQKKRDFQRWKDAFREPSLSVLLILQVFFIFLVRPLVSLDKIPGFVLDWFLFAIAFISVFVVSSGGWTRVATLVAFGLLVTTTEWDKLISPGPMVHFLSMAVACLFTLTVTVIIGGSVFGVGRVTQHHIQGAIVVYLNIALIFVTIYAGLADLIPHFFSHLSDDPQAQFDQLLYFSLGSLTTATLGDISPLNPMARSLANLESVTG
ncbi:MAG TPA: hypothetical protein VFR02_05480, partial [bacterium]|nr:hypothetical protein [bacterium]